MAEKNKVLAKSLEQQRAHNGFRREKIAAAQKNGQLDAPKLPAIAEEQLACISRFWKGMGLPARVLPPSSALIRAENLRPGIFGCQNAGRKAHGLDGGLIEAKSAADIAAMHA